MKQSNILLSLITAIYLRISREDDRDGESYSIENQKKLLIDYADKNGFPNVKAFIEMKITKMIQFEIMNPRQKARNKGF